VRGARVHNLRDIDVDVPLGTFTAIAGVSGSGKSSLAMGVLYAEGARRYLEALSTFTRRRLTGPGRAEVDQVRHIPSAVALRQRPATPSIRSTVGTATEVLNALRLAISRLGAHPCPNGHLVPPGLAVAQMADLACPVCGAAVALPGAESFAFNSGGACPTCQGTGQVREIDPATLIPDPSLTIDEHAVASWMFFGKQFMPQIVRQLGVRTDVPFRDLTDREKDIVLHGPEVKRRLVTGSSKGGAFDLQVTYDNAFRAVEKAITGAKSERGAARLRKFFHEGTCPDCGGSRLGPAARASRLDGHGLAELSGLTLRRLREFAEGLPERLAAPGTALRELADRLAGELAAQIGPLERLGLGYLELDRPGATLSNGELQRIHLARTLRGETTGVLYVLDEPSIGLHPDNVAGLIEVIRGLVAGGNTALVVDHDPQVLRAADWLIEIGPGAGRAGGRVVAAGPVADVARNPESVIAPYLDGRAGPPRRRTVAAGSAGQAGKRDKAADAGGSRDAGTAADAAGPPRRPGGPPQAVAPSPTEGRESGSPIGEQRTSGGRIPIADAARPHGEVAVTVGDLFTLHDVRAAFPVGRLTAVTGVSGSGKTTLVLDSLVPALAARSGRHPAPAHVTDLAPGPIRRVVAVDSRPVGKNMRSTVATYSGVFDQIRALFAAEPETVAAGCAAGAFSYNTEAAWCPTCRGIGQISLDIQFLPDLVVTCPDCGGSRYAAKALAHPYHGQTIAETLAITCAEAVEHFDRPGEAAVRAKLELLTEVGLGYLTLGEATPALSGGEAQRLRLVGELGRKQDHTLFVFDEPTIGLHPADVRVLIGVFDRLIGAGATVVVIEHDLDLVAAADWVVDMGPGAGVEGGRVVAAGTPRDVAAGARETGSVTGRWLARYFAELEAAG
jgi:excinuclease ABC subunit A